MSSSVLVNGAPLDFKILHFDFKKPSTAMKKTLLSLILILSAFCLHAQTLVPYFAKNGLTGFADEAGNLIIQPQFNEVYDYFRNDQLFVRAKKDGSKVVVLRNGRTFPDPNGYVSPMPVWNYNRTATKATDTLHQLATLDLRDKNLIIHLGTGKEAEFPKPSAGGLRFWFPVEYHWTDEGGRLTKFRFGCARVGRPGDQINFIDTALNLIFKEDFAAGTVVDDTFFIVANAGKKCAVADRSGRVRTKYGWQVLVPSQRKGIFIVDRPESGIFIEKGKAGLIDADGKVIISPKFDDLRPAGEQWLIFKKGVGEGLMDYAGKVVLPAQPGGLTWAFGETFIRTLGGKHTIIQANGEPKFPETFDNLDFFPQVATSQPHFQFKIGPTCGALDTAIKTIYRDTCDNYFMAHLNTENGVFFKTAKLLAPGKMALGLTDFSGKEVLPKAYESFEKTYGEPFIKFQKSGHVGLLSTAGSVVLPCQYEEIAVFHGENQPSVWAREKGSVRWLGFHPDGRRYPETDCFNPTKKENDLFTLMPLRGAMGRKIGLFDGTVIDAPASWGQSFNLKAANSPAGLVFIKQNPTDCEVLDRSMRSIMPKGFRIPGPFFHQFSFEKTGLVAVWQSLSPERRSPPPSVVPDKPTAPKPAEPVAKQPQVVIDAPPVEEVSASKYACGIINARGEWVIPPVEGVRFLPISWTLVAEIPEKSQDAADGGVRRLHRVNVVPNATVFDVFSTAGHEYPQEATNFKTNIMTMDPADPQQSTILSTWFTKSGEQLAPYKFYGGPSNLGSLNTVEIHEPGRKYQAIINEKAETVVDLSGYDRLSSLKDGYLACRKNNKWGVLDSTGKGVLPFEFGELIVLAGGRFLSEFVDASPKYRLLDWQGKVLEHSDGVINLEKMTSGHFLIRISKKQDAVFQTRTLVFSPQGERLLDLPGQFAQAISENKQERFWKFYEDPTRVYWVNVATGRVYRE